MKEVVLEHIPECPDRVVEGSPSLDAERLGQGDLDIVDVVPIPNRLEQGVGKAKHQEVENRFLAEIVIDPIDPILGVVLLEESG